LGGNPVIARYTWNSFHAYAVARRPNAADVLQRSDQPPQGFDFNPTMRFLLGDEAGNIVTLAVGPNNSDVPSRS
jgi:hypothetical protein